MKTSIRTIRTAVLGAVCAAVLCGCGGKQEQGAEYQGSLVTVTKYPKLKEFIEKYNADWSARKGWSPELYQQCLAEAARLRNTGKASAVEYERLCRSINQDVLERMTVITEPQLHMDSVPENEVANNVAGMKTLLAEDVENPNASEQIKAWTKYGEIKDFVNKTYTAAGFGTGLNGDLSSWTSFDTHKRGILAKRDAHRNDKLYSKYFTANTMLKQGLDGVEGKVEQCRRGYYEGIAAAVESKYRNVPKFDASPYQTEMRNAQTDSEWREASDRMDRDWAAYESSFMTKRRTALRILDRYKGEVSDKSLVDKVQKVASAYEVPGKPSKPAKPSQR